MSLLLAALAFGTFTLTRGVLLAMTGASNVPAGLWIGIFLHGVLSDAATLAYVLAPFLLIDAVVPASVYARRWFIRLRQIILTVALFILLFLGVMEITFWMEFHTRFNFIALDYLIYTTEVLRNIWESYPVLKIGLAVALLSWAFVHFIVKPYLASRSTPSGNARLGFAAAALLLPFASFALASNAHLARFGNTYADELSRNGLFTLAAAFRNNELDYEQFYATLPPEKAEAILRGLGVKWTSESRRREKMPRVSEATAGPLPAFLKRRPKNIILISVESLSAQYLGAYGAKFGWTPRLDGLAREGLLFRRLYATGTRTVRGLEALTLATPPIPGQAILRRLNYANLASTGGMLRRQNFKVFFMYGGYGYFDNMKAFFEANAYVVQDRTSIPGDQVSFENVWGVADEDLYNHTLRVLDQPSSPAQPFFVHIMTTSNHRPYTYPDGRIDIPSPGSRAGAVKYTDFAIGQFIDKARAKPWFKDTLFVFVADHCASVAGKTELPVEDFRIPLLLYGPELVKPGTMDRMISQIDIAPMMLNALGKAGEDNFIGIKPQEQKGAARAFISTYQDLGYYKNDVLVILKPNRQVETYHVDPKTGESTRSKPDPTLTEEAIAYYQTASRAFKLGQLELLWK